MESSLSLTSSSSSSSSPSIGFGSNEPKDKISLAVEELRNGDVVQAINLLTNTIDNKLFLFKTNNNNNMNHLNANHNKTSDQMTASAKELSKLYAIRGDCYLKLGLHQLAFDDCVNGTQLDTTNPNCYYLKGLALLGMKQKESAEQAFRMSKQLRQNYCEANEESVKIRYEALKEAGFDSETAIKFAPKSRSVDEAIDHILSTSLTSDQLSNLRASYTQSLTNNSNQFPTQTIDSQFSGIFGNKNQNNINAPNGPNGNTKALGSNAVSESIGLKLISDIDNCLGSILDSDEEKSKFFEEKKDKMVKMDDNISATNANNFSNNDNNSNSNNNFCDIGENSVLSRSLSPQISQNIFGISSDLQLKQKANNFCIDLNRDSLGSQIIPKTVLVNTFGSTSGEPQRKTFADIASANTKKVVQPMKMSEILNSNAKNNQKMDLQKVSNSGTKLSSLESFGAPVSNTDALNQIEKIGQIVVSSPEPTRPSNLMGYKGLWVCNISPDASYITLKKVFRKYGNFTGIQTFERKATNGSNIVFVHYDNSQAPTDAIADLFGVYRKDICFDENTLLKLRYTPSMEQTKNGDLPSMEKAKRVVEKSGECFNWRLSTGCHKGDRCLYKHIPINKSVDSQPWVKALKKKANET